MFQAEGLFHTSPGCIRKEIANKMATSFDTVRFHFKQIYAKLHVRSRAEAIVKGLR